MTTQGPPEAARQKLLAMPLRPPPEAPDTGVRRRRAAAYFSACPVAGNRPVLRAVRAAIGAVVFLTLVTASC